MPTLKDLTIAIVTYKRPRQLELCLDSLRKQSHQPEMLIIIDSFLKNTSIPESRNLALKQCQTKYIAFVDDDCILEKNWVINAYNSIVNNQNLAYVVGKSNLLNNNNLIAKTIYRNYLNWFNQTHTLDTKNVIFNFNKIKKLHFNTQFKIFEDIDFDQQLKFNHLVGSYNPHMTLLHPEVSNLITALKKNYYRGQFKSIITKKWGNFDNYQPSFSTSKNIIDSILKLAFILGYQKNPPRPITIINNIDAGANGERYNSFHQYLSKHHFFINTINSQAEFEKVINTKKSLFIYGFTLLKYKILKIFHDKFKINQSSAILFQTLTLKKHILDRLLRLSKTSIAILQYPEDMMVTLTKNRPYKTLYDSPTIYFRELELSNSFPQKTITKLKLLESKVFKSADYVSFHWYSYIKLAKKYGFKINQPITLNWGCSFSKVTTKYKTNPKIIYLGKLNSYWTNPQLLSSISKHTNLIIYSYEKPSSQYYTRLPNYRGYLKNINLISKFQFGLITITQDDLRSKGFSAKYLLYLSQGLPVLCPEWRKDNLLKSATIYYNENNIKKQIKKFSQEKYWLKKHHAALKLSEKLKWENTLIPLLKIINSTNEPNQ